MKCIQCDNTTDSKSVYCNSCGLKIGESELDKLITTRQGFDIKGLLKTLSFSSNEHDDNSARYWFERGIVKIEGRDFYEAIEYFKKALSIDETMGFAFINTGWCYNQLRMPFHAIDWLEKAIGLGMQQQELLENICIAYQDTLQYDKALRIAEVLIELNPGDKQALDVKNHLTRERAEYQGIKEQYEQFGAVWNGNPYFMVQPDDNGDFDYSSSGLLSCNDGDFQQAISFFEQSIKLEDTVRGSTAKIGYCLNRLGRLDEGIVWLEKALDNNNEDWFAAMFLADSYIRQGKFYKSISVVSAFSSADMMVKYVKVEILKEAYQADLKKT